MQLSTCFKPKRKPVSRWPFAAGLWTRKWHTLAYPTVWGGTVGGAPYGQTVFEILCQTYFVRKFLHALCVLSLQDHASVGPPNLFFSWAQNVLIQPCPTVEAKKKPTFRNYTTHCSKIPALLSQRAWSAYKKIKKRPNVNETILFVNAQASGQFSDLLVTSILKNDVLSVCLGQGWPASTHRMAT
jgi:hypothetical protein